MPVWHEITKEWRRDHDLVVLGITQEQHPDRCRLFSQWKEFDFPILWDPFNVTRSKVVPRVLLIDEHGVVVADRVNRSLAESFALGERDAVEPTTNERWERLADLDAGIVDGSRTDARVMSTLSAVLWKGVDHIDEAIDALTAHTEIHDEDAASRFRLGVAYRMRHDSNKRQPTDFQAAVDHWSVALAMDGSQYIWRRRIQQYGPLLDKPYPFYDWVTTATAEIEARGDVPIVLPVELSTTERLGRTAEVLDIEESPDLSGDVPVDDGSWLDVAVTVVPDTAGNAHVFRLHITARPGENIHWNNEADPAVLWVPSTDTIAVTPSGQRAAMPPTLISDEERSFDLELRGPEGEALAGSGTVTTGSLFFHACEGVAGVCIYMRRDIEIKL